MALVGGGVCNPIRNRRVRGDMIATSMDRIIDFLAKINLSP
jgi:hypothetical protein